MTIKISYKFNIDTNTWSSEFSDEDNKLGDSFISIGFEQNAGYPIMFNNMKYGYSFSEVITDENEILANVSYPPDNIKLESTDQEWMIPFTPLPTLNDRKYHLMVWANNNGHYVSTETTFNTPREAHTYPSWTYDSDIKRYIPPIPKPETEGIHIWDEDAKQWDTGNVKSVGPFLWNEETKSWEMSPDYELS